MYGKLIIAVLGIILFMAFRYVNSYTKREKNFRKIKKGLCPLCYKFLPSDSDKSMHDECYNLRKNKKKLCRVCETVLPLNHQFNRCDICFKGTLKKCKICLKDLAPTHNYNRCMDCYQCREIICGRNRFANEAKVITTDRIFRVQEKCYSTCKSKDPLHYVKCHINETFKLKKFENAAKDDFSKNVVIGFHQTTIESAKNILEKYFLPGKSGMLGPGIYFAINKDATEFKSLHKGGAYFCASISLGKVQITKDLTTIQPEYNSLYLNHRDGHKKDEFIITNAKQIREYVIVISKEKLEDYKKKMGIS